MRSMELDDVGNTGENTNKIEIGAILMALDYLMPEVRLVDPMSGYFLQMCIMSLFEIEQEKAIRLSRH